VADTNDSEPTPRSTPRPHARPSSEDLAEEIASGAVQAAGNLPKGSLAQTLLASAFTALISGGVVGFGGSQAASKLEAKVDVLTAKLDAITAAASRSEATAAAQQHEERIRRLEAVVADHELKLRLAAGK